VVTNAGAQPGDVLVLTKPLGLGIITTGIDRGLVADGTIATVTAVMSRLNRAASEVMLAVGVHACTDVSGFGLLGHLREMIEASGVGATVSLDRVPVLPEAWELVEKDSIPDGSRNNHRYLAGFVAWEQDVTPAAQMILCDAQTSGGLLIAVPPERAERLLAALGQAGVESAVAIGQITPAPQGRIRVSKA